MRTVLKFKWLILALWIAAAVGLMFTAPDMERLVREKGQITVPDGYSSTEAAKLAAELEKLAANPDRVAAPAALMRA